MPDAVEMTRQDTICAVFVDASSGLWHQAAWGVWQGASRTPNGTNPASRGAWNALRIYFDIRPAALNAGALPVEQRQPALIPRPGLWDGGCPP